MPTQGCCGDCGCAAGRSGLLAAQREEADHDPGNHEDQRQRVEGDEILHLAQSYQRGSFEQTLSC